MNPIKIDRFNGILPRFPVFPLPEGHAAGGDDVQVRLVLVAQGLLEEADALIKGIPGQDGGNARTYWEFATQVLRTAQTDFVALYGNPLTCQHLANMTTITQRNPCPTPTPC